MGLRIMNYQLLIMDLVSHRIPSGLAVMRQYRDKVLNQHSEDFRVFGASEKETLFFGFRLEE